MKNSRNTLFTSRSDKSVKMYYSYFLQLESDRQQQETLLPATEVKLLLSSIVTDSGGCGSSGANPFNMTDDTIMNKLGIMS